jgi:hypothetical protein
MRYHSPGPLVPMGRRPSLPELIVVTGKRALQCRLGSLLPAGEIPSRFDRRRKNCYDNFTDQTIRMESANLVLAESAPLDFSAAGTEFPPVPFHKQVDRSRRCRRERWRPVPAAESVEAIADREIGRPLDAASSREAASLWAWAGQSLRDQNRPKLKDRNGIQSQKIKCK